MQELESFPPPFIGLEDLASDDSHSAIFVDNNLFAAFLLALVKLPVKTASSFIDRSPRVTSPNLLPRRPSPPTIVQ